MRVNLHINTCLLLKERDAMNNQGILSNAWDLRCILDTNKMRNSENARVKNVVLLYCRKHVFARIWTDVPEWGSASLVHRPYRSHRPSTPNSLFLAKRGTSPATSYGSLSIVSVLGIDHMTSTSNVSPFVTDWEIIRTTIPVSTFREREGWNRYFLSSI